MNKRRLKEHKKYIEAKKEREELKLVSADGNKFASSWSFPLYVDILSFFSCNDFACAILDE